MIDKKLPGVCRGEPSIAESEVRIQVEGLLILQQSSFEAGITGLVCQLFGLAEAPKYFGRDALELVGIFHHSLAIWQPEHPSGGFGGFVGDAAKRSGRSKDARGAQNALGCGFEQL